MVCLRISVIYICPVRVAVDPLKGDTGVAGIRCFLHPVMSSGDTLSEPQSCQTYHSLDYFYNKVLVLVRYETGENYNTAGATQGARVKGVRLVPRTSARTCAVLF